MNEIETAINIPLDQGRHQGPDQGLNALEAVAWIEGMSHSDQPPGVCRTIAAYVRGFDGFVPRDRYQQIACFLGRLAGSQSAEHEVERARFLAWQSVRKFSPNSLEAMDLTACAQELRTAGGLRQAEQIVGRAQGAVYRAVGNSIQVYKAARGGGTVDRDGDGLPISRSELKRRKDRLGRIARNTKRVLAATKKAIWVADQGGTENVVTSARFIASRRSTGWSGARDQKKVEGWKASRDPAIAAENAAIAGAITAECVLNAAPDYDWKWLRSGPQANAALNDAWADVFDTLDGVLRIGPPPTGFCSDVAERVKVHAELVKNTAARLDDE